MIEHFERYLGPIQEGWAVDADGEEMPFQIVRFDQGSDDKTVSFATLGLGRYPLRSTTTARTFRHELLLLAPNKLARGPLPSLLQPIGQACIQDGRALLRGDVLGPRGPLLAGSQMEAFYVAMPAYFPDEFATCEGPDGPVVISWLVPIAAPEAHYVARHGWEAFEDRLVEQDPDLTDFGRHPMKL
ncbi:suppressor of fused domain protein [Kribbella sp. NPDC050470]|uniref:suppressor of fused domain protein n=1 Tax=Kribbella sp. NPDC050470 TaxID=3364117 RepID=UPI0037ADCCAA